MASNMDDLSFAHSLAGSTKGTSEFAKKCYQFYTDRKFKADVRQWLPWGNISDEVYKIYIDQTTDVQLKYMLQSFLTELEKLNHLNQMWALLLVQFFKVSMPKDFHEWDKLRQRIEKYRKTKGPTWISDSLGQDLITKTGEIVTSIEHLASSIDERLRQLYSPIFADKDDLGDQRAKDLIDQSESEINPKQAIQLLQKALHYGKSGIQASKAFISLGIRYEDLGDIPNAIDSYTQSLEAWLPSALVLFWRGQLYYRQGQWNDAFKDFETALSFATSESLPSSEREQATRYVAELRALNQ